MPPTLFLDANILFTAAISASGNARALFDLAAAGHCLLCTSPFAVEEARRNLRAKYSGQLRELDRLLDVLSVVPEADRSLTELAGKHVVAKDAPILAAGIACNAEFLVTGDKRHFDRLFGVTIRTVKVVSLTQAVELVLATES
jgi:predicted nucleic acid-binding protein